MSQLPNCGFHRFMDAVIGTDWRTSVPAQARRRILAAWNKGVRFRGLQWAEIRIEVQKMISGIPQ